MRNVLFGIMNNWRLRFFKGKFLTFFKKEHIEPSGEVQGNGLGKAGIILPLISTKVKCYKKSHILVKWYLWMRTVANNPLYGYSEILIL